MAAKVKICGLRDREEARLVCGFMPDYVGLVFAPGTRTVDAARALEILDEVPAGIETVGVLVNMETEQAAALREALGLDILQLHGDETLEEMRALGGRIWKSLHPGTDPETVRQTLQVAERVLMDSGNCKQRGGTGRVFDWSLLTPCDWNDRLVLAGGLNPDNIRLALETVRPDVVDVSSGVETDGRKDPDKVRRLIMEVRSWK